MIHLNPEFWPPLQTSEFGLIIQRYTTSTLHAGNEMHAVIVLPRGVMDIYGMTEECCLSNSGTIHLGLAFLQTGEYLQIQRLIATIV